MVERIGGSENPVTRVLARGNFSLSGQGLFRVVLALAVVTLGIAGWLAWQGYWPVLALATIQVALVSVLLVRCWYGCWAEERIEVGRDRIRVERTRYGRSEALDVESPWAKIYLEAPYFRGYPPRVLLRSRGRQIELGAFLVAEERVQLAELLAEAIREVCVWQGSPLQNDLTEGVTSQ